MSLRLAALLLAAAAPARADMKAFNIGRGGNVPFAESSIESRDGYHLAYLWSDGEKDHWEKDGVEFAHAQKGIFTGDRNPGYDASDAAVMSDDGKVLLHLMTVRDADGNAMVSAALNGKPVGGMHLEIKLLRVSPRGSNVAFAARDASGWTVHSAQGTGPALPEAPAFLFVSDSETVYFTRWQGRMWRYRGGAPTAVNDFASMSASADLRRIGGVYDDPKGNEHWVEIDGTASGPWKDAGVPVYSDDGSHYAFLAQSAATDSVVIDGAAKVAEKGAGFPLVDDAGVPFYIVPPAVDGGAFVPYRDGVKLPVSFGNSHFNREWAAFSPSGAHYAYWASDRLVVDGKTAEKPAPQPGDGMRIVFDGERSFHYMTGGSQLVCVSIDGLPAAKTRCAKIGRSLDKSAALLEPAAR